MRTLYFAAAAPQMDRGCTLKDGVVWFRTRYIDSECYSCNSSILNSTSYLSWQRLCHDKALAPCTGLPRSLLVRAKYAAIIADDNFSPWRRINTMNPRTSLSKKANNFRCIFFISYGMQPIWEERETAGFVCAIPHPLRPYRMCRVPPNCRLADSTACFTSDDNICRFLSCPLRGQVLLLRNITL